MANAVDGIGTINVGQLVTQLMSVEGRQQSLLKAQQSRQQSVLAAYQQINTNVKSAQTSAETIIGSILAPRPWSLMTATSSSTTVAATAVAGAVSGTYSFDVQSVAAAHRILYDGTLDLTTTAAADPVTVAVGSSTPVTLDLKGDFTLQGVITAINTTPGLGVKAAAIQTGTGAYRLQLNASATGAASQFTVTGLDPAVGAAVVTQTGTDASIKFGPAAGDVVSSASNTFGSAFPGVSFTVSKVEAGVTLTVARDLTGMTKQVQSLVDAMNTSLSTIGTLTAYAAGATSRGPLAGDPAARQLASSLTSTLFDVAAGTTLATVGIQVTRAGQLTFDAAKFQDALASDPDGSTAAIQRFATCVATVASGATKSGTGTIPSAIEGRQSEIDSLGKSIADWDMRLAARQDQLTRQYAALNTQLSRMQDQSNWLTGQLASLSNR